MIIQVRSAGFVSIPSKETKPGRADRKTYHFFLEQWFLFVFRFCTTVALGPQPPPYKRFLFVTMAGLFQPVPRAFRQAQCPVFHTVYELVETEHG